MTLNRLTVRPTDFRRHKISHLTHFVVLIFHHRQLIYFFGYYSTVAFLGLQTVPLASSCVAQCKEE